MRSYITMFLIIAGTNLCLSQSNKSFSIPVLKESKQIDSLFDGILLGKIKPTRILVKKHRPVKQLFILYATRSSDADGKVYVSISLVNKKISNQYIGIMQENKVKNGFFLYKGKEIYVWTRNDYSSFFHPTSKSINYLITRDNYKESKSNLGFRIWDFICRNGVISIRQTKKRAPKGAHK